jgi:hypothetical protein
MWTYPGPWQPVGGCIPKFGPPSIPGPPKKIFPESKNFSGKCWLDWGWRSMLFFENKSSRNLSQNNFFPEISKIFSEEILHFLKILQFQHARAPYPQVGPPFFTFFGGVTPPPHPPGGTALDLSRRLRLKCHPKMAA